MNLTIPQPALAQTLAKASRALATKSALPILYNFLLDAKDDALTVAATNLEITIVATVPAEINQTGSLTVPGKLLLDVVSSYRSDATIKLETRKHTLIVSAGDGSTSEMRGIEAEEFPALQTVSDGKALVVDPVALRDVLSKVSYAAATDASRPVLNAVNMRLQGDRLEFGACDSFRMSMGELVPMTACEGELSVNLPLKTASELAKLLDGEESPIQILVSKNHIRVSLANLTVISTQVVGTYPTIRQFVPASYALTATITKRDLESAVRVAKLFAERGKHPAVRMTIGEVGIVVKTIGDTGQSDGLVKAEIQGDGFDAAYNVFYLDDVLGRIGSETVVLRGNGSMSPSFLVGENDPTIHLIMPMYLKE